MGFFPPLPRPDPLRAPDPGECRASDPARACAARVAAVRTGEMVFDRTRRGWVFTEQPLRTAWPRARFYAAEGRHPHTDGEPWLWANCPWCGGELPDLTPPPQADGASDGDGPE